MNSFALLYILYVAKLGLQFSIYLITISYPKSPVIVYLAVCVVLLAIVPMFHTIIHLFSQNPLSYPTLVAYICSSLVLNTLWYTPICQINNTITFILVTVLDCLTLLFFLLSLLRQWRQDRKSVKDEEAGKGLLKTETIGEEHPVIRTTQSVRQINNDDRYVPRGGRWGNNPLDVTSLAPSQSQIHTSTESLGRIKSRGEVGHEISGFNAADIRHTAIYNPVTGQAPSGFATGRVGNSWTTTGDADREVTRDVADPDPVVGNHRTGTIQSPTPQRRFNLEDIHPALRPNFTIHGGQTPDLTPRQTRLEEQSHILEGGAARDNMI